MSKIKKTGIILSVLILLAAGAVTAGYIVLPYLRDRDKPREDLTHLRLKPEIVLFTFRIWPDAYSRLVHLDTEISLIDQEMERLTAMEKEFPQQKRIILDEKSLWDRTGKSLATVLEHLEKEVETIYVTYSLNEARGLQALKDSQESALKPADDALAESAQLTARLKTKSETKLLDRVQSLFSK
ncbi:MAG: hypothetical protein ACOZF0_09760 [Thermodesulfobacteriota bacterium]